MNTDISNLDLKTIIAKLGPAFVALKKYAVLIVFTLVITSYSLLVFEVNRLTSAEPTEEAIAEKLSTVKVPRIDERTLQKIRELEDQNVQTKSIFNQARQNPFAE